MPTAVTETAEFVQEPTITDRVADAVRHAAHLSHEARLVTSIVKDAGEESVHAAKRIFKRVRRSTEVLEDLRDDAAHYVKHQPFKAVGIAVGVGLLLGVAAGWMSGRCGQSK